MDKLRHGIGTGLDSVVSCAFMEQDQVLPVCFLVPLEASYPSVRVGLGGMMVDPKCCLPLSLLLSPLSKELWC